jgi:two-component system sensor histidine kinase MtrB
VGDINVSSAVVLDVEPGVTADVDSFRFSQILVNLLTNADRYGEPPITLTASATGDTVTIAVRDHGPGVPPEFVDNLFDSFSRAHRAKAHDERGTGLGLTIVRNLARAHGGDVTYRDAGPGACFVVELPRRAPS